MVKYEIARQKAVDSWLEATTARPLEAEAAVVAQINRLRDAARERQRLEVRRDWVGPPGELAARTLLAKATLNKTPSWI